MTAAKRASGRIKTLSQSVLRERMNYISPISRGKSDNINIFDLTHATDNVFSEPGMSDSLRSEFDKPELLAFLKSKSGKEN
jgi:hypothetical protein